MTRTVPAHHKPYPELVEPLPNPRPYTVIDTTGLPWLPTNGMTSIVERKLLVPLVEGAESVARHELAHVRCSPKELPRVAYDLRYLMAVEDARLNLGLVRVGLPVLLSAAERGQVAELARADLAERDLLGFVLRALAAQGTNVELALLGELARHPAAVRDLAYRYVRRVRIALLRSARARAKAVADFALVLRLAEGLARELEPELERLGFPRTLPFAIGTGGVGCCLGHGTDPRSPHLRHGAHPGASAGTDSSGAAAGEMTIAVAKLVHASPTPRGGRRGRARAASEGVLPRFPYRWPIDQAIFRRASRVRGGTVLIDTSGSMSLDAAGVDHILSASSGAALIAIYSGKEKVGELRIVARDGRRADARDLVPFGRGNVVDEPALAWLAQQDGPRLWISDGGVTGVGDTPSAALQERCKSLVQRGRIRRVKNIEEAAACLARGTRHAGVA